MTPPLLNQHLLPVLRRHRRLQLWRGLGLCWALGALTAVGLVGLQSLFGGSSRLALPAVAVGTFLGLLFVLRAGWRAEVDLHWLAGQIEREHPELNSLLLAAIEQQPGSDGKLSYLQQRVISEAVAQCRRRDWADAIPSGKLRAAFWLQTVAFALFIGALTGLQVHHRQVTLARVLLQSISVTPGDTSLERGNSFVVLARFEGRLPPGVNLLIGATPETSRSQPLVKSLDDPVFGGTVPEVNEDFVYRLEYSGQRTRDFQVKVFEHPRLERADVLIQYPAYTSLPEKRIEDTRRVSAVEGSQLGLALQLNKPVASARLIGRDKSIVPLTVATNQATAALTGFPLVTSQSYQLELVDADQRTNKVPAQFVLDVLKNRVPELKIAAPRGDQRVSALEEIAFQAEAWDDFGLSAYGLAYSMGGAEPTMITLGEGVPAKEKRNFSHLLKLEELGGKPDDLIAYFVWADDIGPDGEVRRNASDMFFAEVRPFEEIFRQGEASEGEGEPQPRQQGNQMGKLADLQKQIITATWKLQRQRPVTVTPQPGEKRRFF